MTKGFAWEIGEPPPFEFDDNERYVLVVETEFEPPFYIRVPLSGNIIFEPVLVTETSPTCDAPPSYFAYPASDLVTAIRKVMIEFPGVRIHPFEITSLDHAFMKHWWNVKRGNLQESACYPSNGGWKYITDRMGPTGRSTRLNTSCKEHPRFVGKASATSAVAEAQEGVGPP